MAEQKSEDTLESLLNQATNPMLREEDWDLISAFSQQINRELEGPQIAVRLLAHKIQSPQEKESLLALSTLESCVVNCGRRFHQEIGKFRFLNELIKVVSPKYLGNHTKQKVKTRCIEILYAWYLGLKHESKIAEAYAMLKQQGIVKIDPTYIENTFEPFPAEKPRLASFEDEEKARVLSKLLKSTNPQDLQAANRMIKNMVKQDAEKSERVSRRINELETIGNNVKLLNEMVAIYNTNSTTASEKSMMKELCEALEKLRPNLFRLATDTDEQDNEGINDILKANDAVMKCMSDYRRNVEGVISENTDGSASKDVSSLLDLNFDHASLKSSPSHGDTAYISSTIEFEESLGATSIAPTNSTSDGNVLDILGDIFSRQPNPVQPAVQVNMMQMQAGLPGMPIATPHPTLPGQSSHFLNNLHDPTMSSGLPAPLQAMSLAAKDAPAPVVSNSDATQAPMNVLDLLGQSLIQENLAKDPQHHIYAPIPVNKLPMNQMNYSNAAAKPSQSSQQTFLTFQGSPKASPKIIPPISPQSELLSLSDTFVPLESIQPVTDLDPVTVYDKNGLKSIMHCGKGRPRPDVAVFVMSTLSTNTNTIQHFLFQAAVPKAMKVKLQPPSSSDLPAFNPILPPSAITQIMLIANPKKEKIRLKYKVSYELNGRNVTDVGDIESFPIQ